MALPTTILFTESNLVGTLTQSATTTDTDIYAKMYDRVTGAARAPEADTRLFVIDKGSPNQPTATYEIILAESHTTTNGITHFVNCVRGLSFKGVALTAGTGKLHVAGAEIGTVDLHYYNNILAKTLLGEGDQPVFKYYADAAARDADVPTPTEGMYCYLEDYHQLVMYDGAKWVPAYTSFVFFDAAARDAYFPTPFFGLSCYLITEGYYTDYTGSGWSQRAAGATPNASPTVSGKVQQATNSNIDDGDETGSTGAPLFVTPANMARESSMTSSSEFLIPFADTDGHLHPSWSRFPAQTFIAGENLAYGTYVYIKYSDQKVYTATHTSLEEASVVGVVIQGGNTNDRVIVQTSGHVTGLSGLTAGQEIFIGTDSTRIKMKVGVATSTTSMLLGIERVFREFHTNIKVGSDTGAITVGTPGYIIDRWKSYQPVLVRIGAGTTNFMHQQLITEKTVGIAGSTLRPNILFWMYLVSSTFSQYGTVYNLTQNSGTTTLTATPENIGSVGAGEFIPLNPNVESGSDTNPNWTQIFYEAR